MKAGVISLEEKKMINGCIEGREKYQRMLYNRYFPKMMTVCMRYAKEREEARDILHEGYMKVFNNIRQFNFDGSFEGWIRRIMINTAINHYNRNNKMKVSHFNYGEDDSEIEHVPELITKEEISDKFAANDLLALVHELPQAYRTVFNLYAIEGYSHKEIAEMLEISEGTSKSNLARARMKLQEALKERGNTEMQNYA